VNVNNSAIQDCPATGVGTIGPLQLWASVNLTRRLGREVFGGCNAKMNAVVEVNNAENGIT
jgi:hypothetical protein